MRCEERMMTSNTVTRSPKKCRDAFLELYGQNLRFNELKGDIELHGKYLSGDKVAMAYFELDDKLDIVATKNLAMDAFVMAAKQQAFHPVREYLNDLKTRHANGLLDPANLDSLVSTYLRPSASSDSEELYSTYLRKFLIAFVARQYAPGSKYDYVVVLQGQGGCRKSTFWSTIIGDEWITDSFKVPSDGEPSPKTLMTIHRFAAVELAELGKRISGRFEATDGIKRFLSATRDDYVPQYGRNSESHARGFVFCGSINDGSAFLSDPTGNRRYQIIPVTCTRESPIDTARLAKERDEILLAALLAWEAGESLDLPVHLIALAEEDNAQYQQETSMLKEVADYAARRMEFTGNELWRDVFSGEDRDFERNKGMLGRTIAQIPWIRNGQKARRNGVRVHAYRVDQDMLRKIRQEESKLLQTSHDYF
jgi:putative DNA primase/helicase